MLGETAALSTQAIRNLSKGLLMTYLRTSNQAQEAEKRPAEFKAYQAQLNQRLQKEVDPEFYSHWDVTPTPLTITTGEWTLLKQRAGMLMRIVEKVVEMYINGETSLDSLFRAYSLFRPYMTKSFMTWQEYGRYDFIINTQGEPVFIELNTAMASGYLPMAHVNRCFNENAPDFLRPEGVRTCLRYDDPDELGRELLRMERVAAAGEGAMAILVDQNKKFHESELIKTSLERAGKKVVIGDVRDLVRKGGDIYLDGQRISSTYNKFRLFGAQHHWGNEAWVENRVFLEAVANKRILSINNFAAMTISEDKAIFAAMRLPAVQAALDPREREIVETNTPTTFVLEKGMVNFQGREVELVDHIKANRGDFICKPRSDYRGSGVYSGRDYDPADWEKLVDGLPGQNYLVQTRVDPAMVDVTHTTKEGSVARAPMRIAGGIYFADVVFQGLVARAAPWEVVNAINHAHVLPIYALEE
jgi:hypothetical protein